MISVENLVSENFPGLTKDSSKMKKPLMAFLKYLFHEKEFNRFEENYPHIKGYDFVDQVLEYFDFSYNLNQKEKERIPVSGRVVIIANHPIGSLDGLAMLKMISEIRSDVKVVANDMLLSIKPLENLLLPVDNMDRKTAKKNIKSIKDHLHREGAVIIFPAGEVSRMGPSGVRDGDWNKGFLRFAEKTQSPILPVFIDARNSIFFYSLSFLARPLSTFWLVREMFKQAKKDIRIKIGHQISFETYNGLPFDTTEKVKLIKKDLYRLSKSKKKRLFTTDIQGIAHPENRQSLREEIRNCEVLGETGDGKKIYLYNYQGDSTVMREVSRLREISFRAVGEGSGKRRDMDHYDSYYDHIILWDDEDLEVVGAYRLVQTSNLIYQQGIESLYTHTLFEFNDNAEPVLSQGVELGRSFIQPRYQGKRSLDYLWYGIGAYVKRFPDMRYLFGPVSISNSYSQDAITLLVEFYSKHFPANSPWASARNPFVMKHSNDTENDIESDYRQCFSELRKQLAEHDVTVPVLYKQYTELCEEGGVQFAAFNIDENFSDCVDGLVAVDLTKIKESKRKRYLG